MNPAMAEIAAKIPSAVLIKPITVVTTSPFVVTIDDTDVAARPFAGQAFTIGGTGFALWAPPLPPLCFATGGVGGDSGWLNATYTSPFSLNATPGQMQYRKVGNVVTVRGGAGHSGLGTTFVACATLPSGFRPSAKHHFESHGANRSVGMGEIATDGTVTVSKATIDTTTMTWISTATRFYID